MKLSLGAACIALSVAACSPGNRNLMCRELNQPAATSTPAASSPFHGSVFTIVMENKSAHEVLDNGAAPYIRSLAELRGRNADWAEKAVREAASLSASAALKQHVIDVEAATVDDLLRQMGDLSVDRLRGRS